MTTVYFNNNKAQSYIVKLWSQTKDENERQKMEDRLYFLSGKREPILDVMHIIDDIFIYKFDIETLLYNYYIIEDSIYKKFINDNYCKFKNEMQIRDYDKFYDIQFVLLSVADLIELRTGYKNKPLSMPYSDYIMNNIQQWKQYFLKKIFNIIEGKPQIIKATDCYIKNYLFIKGEYL